MGPHSFPQRTSSPPAAAVRGRGSVRREHRGMQLRRTSPQFVAAVAQGEGGREGRNGTGWGPLFSSTALELAVPSIQMTTFVYLD